MGEYIQVLTTAGEKKDAERIAKAMVEKRLAGCVQILGPITSTYWWKGNIEKTEEWLCLIKSKKAVYEKLEEAIKKIHPYQLPEIIATPIISGGKEYLRWLGDEVKKG